MKRSLTPLFAAVSMAVAAIAAPAQAEKINVFSGVSPVFGPPFVADVNGYFKDAGLDVTVRTFQAGAAATEAFRGGGAQYLVTCDQPMLIMAATGAAKIVAQFSQTEHMVYMLGHKSVKSAADLKGKKVGVFRKSASEFMLEQYLKSGGLKTSDIEMVHLAPFDQIPAVVKGDVDAISLWKPYDLKVMALSKNHKILADTGDMGYKLYCGMLISNKYLESGDKAEINKFMGAVKKGADYLASNQMGGVKVLAKFTKLPENEVDHVTKGEGWSMVIDDAFMKQMRAIERFMLDLKMIDKGIDWKNAVDWSLLKNLDPNLVKVM